MERDRGSKSPVSFQPPPRGADKIYTYDVVFPIGETNINDKGKTKFLIPHKSDVVFLIEEAKTNDPSQT